MYGCYSFQTKSNNHHERTVTITLYEIIINISLCIYINGVPFILMLSASTPTNTSGNNIGRERTGNNAPLVFAFAMIAEIIVDDEAIPILPKNIVVINPSGFLTANVSKNIKNNRTVSALSPNDSIVLKINFPKYTDVGELVNCNKSDVPRSSSLTNPFANPVMLLKNITTQSMPANVSVVSFSPEVANSRITIDVTTNNNTADIEYRVRNSLRISFWKTATTGLSIKLKFKYPQKYKASACWADAFYL